MHEDDEGDDEEGRRRHRIRAGGAPGEQLHGERIDRQQLRQHREGQGRSAALEPQVEVAVMGLVDHHVGPLSDLQGGEPGAGWRAQQRVVGIADVPERAEPIAGPGPPRDLACREVPDLGATGEARIVAGRQKADEVAAEGRDAEIGHTDRSNARKGEEQRRRRTQAA